MKTEKSGLKFEQAKQHLAGGVASSLRTAMKPVPLYAESARGAYLKDVDGNEYIDYLLAYGPLILGHAHEGLTSAILKAMQNGFTYGLQHEGEIELADRLVEILPCAEQVAISGSGTEAVMLALRLARAHTGKQKVIRFHGHYHGWSDSIFTSFPSSGISSATADPSASTIIPGTGGQSENSLEDVILLPWNDLQAVETVLRERASEIAAVITEPVMCNSGCIQPKPGYLEQLRQLTKELGIVLIFDEVITGFRLSLGGAHGRFGINPDMVTIGKAMGGGIAISAVAGSKEIMQLISNGKVNHLGTLNGNCVATAAALATLEELAQNNGAVYEQMESLLTKLASGIRDLMKRHNHPGVVNQLGPVFHMMFINESEVTDFETFNRRDAALYARFAELMLSHGVLIRPNGLWYISTVHGEQEIEATLKAVDAALSQLA